MVNKEDLKTNKISRYTRGSIRKCKKLNIRKAPSLNSDIICTVDKTDDIIINHHHSNNGWYYVIVNGNVIGYCVKEFVYDTNSIVRGM